MAPKEVKHFLFPIGCLRVDKSLNDVTESDRKTLLSHCLNCHVRDAMEHVDTDDDQVIAAADDEAAKHGYTTPSDEWSDDEIALLYATRISHFSHGEKDTSKILKQIRKSVSEVTVGKSRVSFPSQLFWEAVREWDFREFAVLCSVWSAIGQCSYRRVTFDKIIRGAHGYGTEKEFALFPKHLETLSRRQVRTTVDKLERRGFFVRCPMNKRHMAYSRNLTLPKLVECIANRTEEKRTPSMDDRLAMVERLRREKQS